MSFVVRSLLWFVGLFPDSVIKRLGYILFTRTRKDLRSAVRQVEKAQWERLQTILHDSKETERGRALGFNEIGNVDAFRERIPISSWNDVEQSVDRMVAGEKNVLVKEDVFFFASTSGTTGRRKLIPVTSQYVSECRVANKVLYRSILLNMPGFIRGKRLTMRSPSCEELGNGKQCGSITVALSGGVSEGEGALDAVPMAVFQIEDFSLRYFLCLRFALQTKVTLISAINPSTLMLFSQTLANQWEALADGLENGTFGGPFNEASSPVLDRLRTRLKKNVKAADRLRKSAEKRGGEPRMQDVFPDVVGLLTWKGGSARWYTPRLLEAYGPLPVLDHGYAATEGCFGAPLSTEGAASLLMPHGHFLEFIPEEDSGEASSQTGTKLMHQLTHGERYRVIVTNGAGLLRYDMNDIIEVVGFYEEAPLIVFRQKGGSMSSLTGEKLGEAHVIDAMAQTMEGRPERLSNFVLSPLLPPSGEGEPKYLLVLEVPGEVMTDAALDAFADRFDEALRAGNEEYAAKRTSMRLNAVEARAVPEGTFAAYRARRVASGAPDAHVKMLHISPDGRLLVELGFENLYPELASLLPCQHVELNHG